MQRKMGFATVLILVLVAFSATAYTAENATITGDGVRLRDVPAVTGYIHETVNKGTRVEVLGVTPFSDTIDGNTASWYHVSHGDNYYLYVFGKFIKPDAGVSVPPLEQPVIAFVLTGLGMFGQVETDVEKNLGEPVSRTEEACDDCFTGHYYITATRKLTFKGITATFEVWKKDKSSHITGITFTTGAYPIWGITVGGSVADVRRLLGEPGAEEGNVLTYWNSSGWTNAVFKTRNGVITEIFLFTEDPG